MGETKIYCVYIASSKSRAIYIGVTSDLIQRMHQHRAGSIQGHTAKYRINRLVHVEATENVHAAIHREKQLKGWRREKKVRLIEAHNPTWEDLAAAWFDPVAGQSKKTVIQIPLKAIEKSIPLA